MFNLIFDPVTISSIYKLLENRACPSPDSDAILGPGRAPLTFGRLCAHVREVVACLNALGIHRHDKVAIVLPNGPEMAVGFLSIACGAVAAPLNPFYGASEFEFYLSDLDARALVVQAGVASPAIDLARGRGIPVMEIVPKWEDAAGLFGFAGVTPQPGSPPDIAEAEDIALVLHTSGTTSRPKAVMLTNANFIYGSEVFRAATGLRHEDHHLIALPLYHSAAQCHALWPSVISGCSVSILSRFSASRFFEQATTHGGTMAALFGSPLRMLLNQPERATDRTHRLRNVTYAQNLTPTQYEDWHRRFGAPLQQLWGMTEICALPIMSPLSGERRLMAMGRPVLGYEAKIVDDSGRELPPHVPGQLIVRGRPGHSLMKGYLKDGAATEKTLRQMQGETWLFSGDTATCDQDGFFYFLDRSNDMIKRSGLNISTSEVESVIAALDGVADVCVCGLPDPMRDESVAAVVVRKPQTQITTDDIRSHCAAHLAPHKVPERIEFFAILPRTSVGKVRKNIVREQLLTGKPETKADA